MTRARINKKHPITRVRRAARYHYLRLLRMDDPPERIARGAALGVFMGVLPTFGLGTFLSLGFAFVIDANKASAVIGSFVMNPLTSAFFWAVSAVLGAAIWGTDSEAILEVIRDGGIAWGLWRIYLVYMTGNIIITGATTAVAYVVVRGGVRGYRQSKERRRKAKGSGI